MELEEGQCPFLDKLWKKIGSTSSYYHWTYMAVLHSSHVMYHWTYMAVLHSSHVMYHWTYMAVLHSSHVMYHLIL